MLLTLYFVCNGCYARCTFYELDRDRTLVPFCLNNVPIAIAGQYYPILRILVHMPTFHRSTTQRKHLVLLWPDYTPDYSIAVNYPRTWRRQHNLTILDALQPFCTSMWDLASPHKSQLGPQSSTGGGRASAFRLASAVLSHQVTTSPLQ